MRYVFYFFFLFFVIVFTSQIDAQTKFRRGIFLHHSTGLCNWGPNGSNTSVPQEILNYNTQHNYTGIDAVNFSKSWFPVNLDNEWNTWDNIFRGTSSESIETFLQTNKILMVKSCYPSSAIIGQGVASDTLTPAKKTIYNYKWHWRNILKVMKNHPENFFIIWTNAPLTQNTTSPQSATWAKQFCVWAKDTLANGLDPLFGAFPLNVYVLDYFSKLADTNGYLPLQYAVSATDPHPNAASTQLVAPQLVQEMFDNSIQYEQIFATTFPLSVSIINGWNIVSVPGLHPTNQNVNTWWQNRNPLADVYNWTTTYNPVSSTAPTLGYWMNHNGVQTYNTGDEWPAGGIQIANHNPVAVTTGWNLIGGYEVNTPVSSLTTTPPGLIVPNSIYGWNGTYFNADNLVPGYGYWILVTGNGVINFGTEGNEIFTKSK